MSKRLLFLEKLTKEGSKDPMAWYGLAMEYKSLDRHEDALSTFQTLKAQNPEYVAMYLMCGGLLEAMGRKDEAAAWYTEGIAAAKKAGNSHALGELQSALDLIS